MIESYMSHVAFNQQLYNHGFSRLQFLRTLLKPERTQNPERAQNVLQLRSGFSTERTFFVLHSKKVRSGFSTERDFQDFRFSTTFWF